MCDKKILIKHGHKLSDTEYIVSWFCYSHQNTFGLGWMTFSGSSDLIVDGGYKR